jgi:hypothetical protein
MTTGMPQKLQVLGRSPRTYTGISGSKEPILNANDRKLLAAFQCKVAASFWDGLASLCLGIAVAALAVAAVVATGGLAAVAIGVAVVATVGASAAGVAGVVAMNSCDKCLQQWQLTHSKVRIEGANALLQNSFLECSKGGVITIVLDPAVALEAAQMISNNNNEEVSDQITSEFLQGVVGTLAAGAYNGAGPAGLIVASGLAPLEYWHDEDQKEEVRKAALDQSFLSDSSTSQETSLGNKILDNTESYGTKELPADAVSGTVDATKISATTTETTITTASASEITAVNANGVTAVSAGEVSAVSAGQKITTTVLSTTGKETSTAATEITAVSASRTTAIIADNTATKGVTAVTAQSAGVATETSVETAVGASIKWGEVGKSMGYGLAGAIVNSAISDHYNTKEDKLYDGSVKKAKEARDSNITFLQNLAQGCKSKVVEAQTQ